MRRLVVAAAVLALAVAVPVQSQDAPKDQKIDITGTWEMTVESPQGSMVVTATYKQDGEKLTGSHLSEMGEAPLTGTVKGNEIEYTITIDAGGQGFSIVHKGKVDGDTIKGTADLGGMGTMNWAAKRKK